MITKTAAAMAIGNHEPPNTFNDTATREVTEISMNMANEIAIAAAT